MLPRHQAQFDYYRMTRRQFRQIAEQRLPELRSKIQHYTDMAVGMCGEGLSCSLAKEATPATQTPRCNDFLCQLNDARRVIDAAHLLYTTDKKMTRDGPRPANPVDYQEGVANLNQYADRSLPRLKEALDRLTPKQLARDLAQDLVNKARALQGDINSVCRNYTCPPSLEPRLAGLVKNLESVRNTVQVGWKYDPRSPSQTPQLLPLTPQDYKAHIKELSDMELPLQQILQDWMQMKPQIMVPQHKKNIGRRLVNFLSTGGAGEWLSSEMIRSIIIWIVVLIVIIIIFYFIFSEPVKNETCINTVTNRHGRT